MFSRKKLALMVLPALCLGLFLGVAPQVVSGADGATGSIELPVDTVPDGQRIYITLRDLTGGADYKLNWTGDDTGYSFTTGASETTKVFPVKIEDPSSGSMVAIYLRAQSAGTALDTVYVTVESSTDVFDTDIFFDWTIPIILIVLVVGIIIRFRQKSR